MGSNNVELWTSYLPGTYLPYGVCVHANLDSARFTRWLNVNDSPEPR